MLLQPLDQMSSFALSQLLAGISFAFGLASFQFKSRRNVLLCLFVSVSFNSAHFFLLDRPGPSALMLLTGMRYLVATVTTDRKVMLCFFAATIAAFTTTFKSPLSLLALCGSLIGTYGSFQPLGQQVRLYFMGGNVCWLIHNTFLWTPVGITMEAVFLASSIIGYWRHYGSPFKRAVPDP
jgi:hypothetical protein